MKLDTARWRIDFEVRCNARQLACPACAAAAQGIHDRIRRNWRHLDFFQYEAWLHVEVAHIGCQGCGKTMQSEVPWPQPGSGFTLLFEALALSLCQSLPVAQAAALLRVEDTRLWRRIKHYVGTARATEKRDGVTVIGIDETSLRRGHKYLTLVHDLQARRLLFATEGRDHQTVVAFKTDLAAHGGEPDAIAHVCMDMSGAYIKGVSEQLLQAAIRFDRFHVVTLANEAMEQVRRQEMQADPRRVRAVFGTERKSIRNLMWGMRRNARRWSQAQSNTMYALQRSNLKTARAWRLKEGLRAAYAAGVPANCVKAAEAALQEWISWARRCRLEPFKKLALTLRERLAGVVRGMLDGRSNAYVEAMNGMLEHSKRAARGFRTAANFIVIAYLRMSKLKHLPVHPLQPAAPKAANASKRYRDGRQVPLKTP